MKVRVTFAFDEKTLRAINYRCGSIRPASRKDVKSWLDSLVTASLQQLTTELPLKYHDRENPER